MKKTQRQTSTSNTCSQFHQNYGLPTKKLKKTTLNPNLVSASAFSQIPSVPQYQLSVTEMQGDPIQLLLKLEELYQEYGAVKLVTPSQWNPPFCFKSNNNGITSRVQHLYKLKFGKAFKQKQEAYNFKSFQEFAKDFEKSYKYKFKKIQGSLQEQRQHEYWKLVEGNYNEPQWKYKVTIQYAADIPVKKYGSGFPIYHSSKSSDEVFDYYTNLFNLNNLYKSPQSILKIADQRRQYISGVILPWVYLGMQYSTFCWHVEDLWVNSLNYSHTGATKTWYVVPKKYKQKFDEYVQRKTGKSDLLNRITYMLDPRELLENGIEVYRADQRPGEYVCTFFKAYHAGFSHGFNVGEAVNFMSPRSLEYMKQAISSLKANKTPHVIPYEWLVYQNFQQKNSYKGFQKFLMSEYKLILNQEKQFLEEVSNKVTIVSGSQIKNTAKYDKNSCHICRNYQYLSSVKCINCNKNYCHKHFHDCCSGKYELIYRQTNQDRKFIQKYIKSTISNPKSKSLGNKKSKW